MREFITKEVRSKSLDFLTQLISIKSKYDETTIDKGLPFGEDIDRALNLVLQKCESFGMKTYKDPKGYYGYAEFGEGEEMVGILTHLDIVPVRERDQWRTDPYLLTQEGEYLYGRGVLDDKGPAVAALYAFNAVKEQVQQFNRRVRFIFFLDEEGTWRSVPQYRKQEVVPTFGFVPDGRFPVINEEKQMMRVILTGPGAKNMQISARGSYSVVPDVATYKGNQVNELQTLLEKKEIPYKVKNKDEIEVIGVSAHAKDVHQRGKNAIVMLSQALIGIMPHPTVGFVGEKIDIQANGQKLFKTLYSKHPEKLSVNVSGLIVDEEKSEIYLDLRFPGEIDKETFVQKLKKSIEPFGLEYKEVTHFKAVNMPEDSEPVKTLLDVYRDKTGDMSDPKSTGGATYARTMKNFVAYGPMRPDGENSAHQPNEHIHLEDEFYRGMDIYAEAIYRFVSE